MTSLLPPVDSRSGPSSASRARSTSAVAADLAHRRPLVVVALVGGISAALAPLAVVCAVTLIGWFATGSGDFGQPSGAVHAGTVAWLMAQGSGVHVAGASIAMVPLGLTLIVAWAVFRSGHRVGDSISAHGPDADRIVDGERDWTVPVAVLLFSLAYGVSVAVVGSLATSSALGLSVAEATTIGFLLAGVVGGCGVAVGSGRAAVWLAVVPDGVRLGVLIAWEALRAWLVLSAVLLVIALAVNFSTAANIASQLDLGTGQGLLMAAATLLLAPNLLAFSGSFALGPGFAFGVGTVVAPSGVVLGPLPMVPVLAALPTPGQQPGVLAWLPVLAVLAGGVASWRVRHRWTSLRWADAIAPALIGGVSAGVVWGVLAHVSGGGIGPGRMSEVGAEAFESMVRAIALMGVGASATAAGLCALRHRHARR